MGVSICVVAGHEPPNAHSSPQVVKIGSVATFLTPIRASLGIEQATVTYIIPERTDLSFSEPNPGFPPTIRDRIQALHRAGEACVFFSRNYTLTGPFRGTVFIRVEVRGAFGGQPQQDRIRVDVV